MEHSLARRAMIDSQLRPQAVTDPLVLGAMASVPREEFAPESSRSFAYFDRPLGLGRGRSMMPPAALGRLLSELAPRPGERALVVGAGSGYSAALLTAIGLAVTALESDAGLAAMARAAGVEIAEDDKASGRYDLILIDGAVEYIPEAIIARLVDGGRLATAMVDRGVSRLVVGRVSGGHLGLRTIADAEVAPLPGFERPRAFTF
ncbi:MAG: protein-L-isoaspartate O-methyltransferase [Pseudomonadota bacterium]|nr:protein-L-isoaspartate O-methyltransferase [Pseudomonadota bacterium]